jgi:hypothetical protein
VNDLVPHVHEFQVRYVERPDSLERQVEQFGRTPPIAAAPQLFSKLTQRPQHPRAVEPLTLTMLTKAHRLFFH